MSKKLTTTAEPELAERLAQDVSDVIGTPAADSMVRKKDIYDHVTVATGLRKREAREAVDAVLAYLHKCLSDGRDVQAPPFGKIKVTEKGKGENLKRHYKLNLQKPGSGGSDKPDDASSDADDDDDA